MLVRDRTGRGKGRAFLNFIPELPDVAFVPVLSRKVTQGHTTRKGLSRESNLVGLPGGLALPHCAMLPL